MNPINTLPANPAHSRIGTFALKTVMVVFLLLELLTIPKYLEIFNYLPLRNVLVPLAIFFLLFSMKTIPKNALIATLAYCATLLVFKLPGAVSFGGEAGNVINELIVFMAIPFVFLLGTNRALVPAIASALSNNTVINVFYAVFIFLLLIGLYVRFGQGGRIYGGDFFGAFALFFGLRAKTLLPLAFYAVAFLLLDSRGISVMMIVAIVIRAAGINPIGFLAPKRLLIFILIAVFLCVFTKYIGIRNFDVTIFNMTEFERKIALNALSSGRYDEIETAFLEFNSPLLGQPLGETYVQALYGKTIHLTHSLVANYILKLGYLGLALTALLTWSLIAPHYRAIRNSNRALGYFIGMFLYANFDYGVALFPLGIGLGVFLAREEEQNFE